MIIINPPLFVDLFDVCAFDYQPMFVQTSPHEPAMCNPVVKELPAPGYIDGSVVTASVVADADGWFYRPGAAVKISGNKTFAKSVSGDHVVGVIKNGLTMFDTHTLAPGRSRILVGLTGGGRRIDRMTALMPLTAGTEICIDPVTGWAKSAGQDVPTGIVWSGGTEAGAEIEVIVY